MNPEAIEDLLTTSFIAVQLIRFQDEAVGGQ